MPESPIDTPSVDVRNQPREQATDESQREPGDRKRLGVVALEVLLVILVVRVFRIGEPFGFLDLAPVIFVGFLVNAFLPSRFRLPFFVLLGMLGAGVVLGPKYGGALVVVGLALIGLCHLPIRYGWRLGLVAVAGGALAGVRAGWVPSPGSVADVVVPILGAMFMFRMAIYLYDLRHEKTPSTLWQRLGYFFLLPNVCFLLFPVVDFQTFKRTHFDRPAVEIYQKGALWMLRGIVHILAYRLVYLHMLPTAAEIQGLFGVVHHILATYGLYLRISGQFHLIVGILCLFGFNLPETHHLYYLATSFTDYWRRINIYWKDFMMKLFYYPAMMRFRRKGMTLGLVLSTAVVFSGTWILHSYQWFWLQGAFPVTVPDILFWGILCVLVIVGSLIEARRTRRRSLGSQVVSWREAFAYSAKVVGMFVTISVLWSLWSSPTLSAWLRMLSQVLGADGREWGLLFLALIGLVTLGGVIRFLQVRGLGLSLAGSSPPYRQAAGYTLVASLSLLLLSLPSVQVRLWGRAGEVVASLQEERLNPQDEATLERGYYEGLLEAPSFTSGLFRIRSRTPDDWVGLWEAGFQQARTDLLGFELRPNIDGVFKRAPFQTNRWGMRDGDYPIDKSEGVVRVAFLGASHEMGSGVREEEIFVSILENRVRRDLAGSGVGFELLNFAVAGYSVFHRHLMVNEKVGRFAPDVVLLSVHNLQAENRLVSLYLDGLLNDPEPASADAYSHLVGDLDLASGMAREEIEARVRPRMKEILGWVFQEIARSSLAMGAVPALVYVPATFEAPDPVGSEAILSLAREAGFVTLNLYDAYEGQVPREIQLAPWDTHPNQLGHQLLARRLYERLQDVRGDLRLPEASSAPGPEGIE